LSWRCTTTRQFVEASRKEQKTDSWLYYTKGHVKTVKVAIKLGLFQGDSLSPLLFCLALIPLTNAAPPLDSPYDRLVTYPGDSKHYS